MERLQNIVKNSDKTFLGLTLALFIGLFVTYSNHFHNDFEFDDFHTIVNNEFIRDLSNIPRFFTDNTTMSTNAGNRSYRPVVATLNAIDYAIAGEMDSFYFHVSIFTSYIVLLIFLFFFMKGLFDISKADKWNKYFALLGTAFYAYHASNAETINYIISRSDSFSTLCIVVALWMYHNQWTKARRLYFIPMILGIYTKQVGVVAMPIIMFYIMFYEEDLSLKDIFLFRNRKGIFNTIKKTIPIALVGIAIFALNQFIMTKGPSANLMQEARVSRFDYFTTQWYVIAHYLGNFILPLNLSADPDIKVIKTLLDARKILGLILISWMMYVAYKTSLKKEERPISFGILWFFVSLAPTSTFHPLNQVSNDHRVFMPYIGLIISVTWYAGLKLRELMEKFPNMTYLKNAFLVLSLAIIAGHAYGTRQRNEVWSSSEKLWYDVTIKSPTNGRGLMNYALHLMKRGQYEETLVYFEKAMEYLPYYSYLHINMGILKDAMGFPEEAEEFFKNALRYDRSNPEAYRFYAKYLMQHGRRDEAISIINQGIERSPYHVGLKSMQTAIMNEKVDNRNRLEILEERVIQDPNVTNLLNLSNEYYSNKMYEECIQVCRKIINQNPDNHLAYNNMCISYIRLNEKNKAINACKKCLEIDPNFQLGKNNLRWAESLPE